VDGHLSGGTLRQRFTGNDGERRSCHLHRAREPPASDQTITIKATSVSDTARSGSANIAFAAIHVSIDPPEAMVDAGSSQVLTASVENDGTDGGVTWRLRPSPAAAPG
jgi:hypothetical protein